VSVVIGGSAGTSSRISGLSDREIAGQLFVSEATVKGHVARTLTKLRLRARAQAVVLAYESQRPRPAPGELSSLFRLGGHRTHVTARRRTPLTVVVGGLVSVMISYAPEPSPLTAAELAEVGVGPRATPVVPVFLLGVVLANLVGSASDVHAVAQAGALPARLTLTDAFAAWLAQPGACGSKLTMNGRDLDVRPMLMIAAEGGGLRAAYWTTAALEQIAAAGNGCGNAATLFSGGASGGALGLTLARFADQPLDKVRDIAGSAALGAASASMFGADLLASATGIRLESGTPHRKSARAWLDRAGLMETVWEDQVDLPQDPLFLPSDPAEATSGDGVVTGQLILTSTVVSTSCRALLSQVDLGPTKTACPASSGPRSFDLFGAYRDCLGNPPALTAGLLASRFPYVTPSGSVDGCGDHEFIQLVDGGYTDNTGLGTITNLATQWLPLVRVHNEKVLGGLEAPIVVPVVVYLENGTGSDYGISTEAGRDDPAYDPDDQGLTALDWPVTPEGLVPPVSAYRARPHQVGAFTSLVKARSLVTGALCRPGVPTCGALRDAVVAWRPQRVFVVHQSPQPTVSAPLGWVLSEASQRDLQADPG